MYIFEIKYYIQSFINPEYELFLLARKIDWDIMEKEFTPCKYPILMNKQKSELIKIN